MLLWERRWSAGGVRLRREVGEGGGEGGCEGVGGEGGGGGGAVARAAARVSVARAAARGAGVEGERTNIFSETSTSPSERGVALLYVHFCLFNFASHLQKTKGVQTFFANLGHDIFLSLSLS